MRLKTHFVTDTSKTATKLRAVRALSLPVIWTRKVLGLSPTFTRKRLGILWDLNPSEAIDACLYIAKVYEPELVKFYQQFIQPGMTILDIGANRGAHTFPMALALKGNGVVHAIEGTGQNFKILNRTLALNPKFSSEVRTHHLFLTAHSGVAPEFVSGSWNIARSINDADRNVLDGGFALSTAGAKAISLDEWVKSENLSQIDLIKLDVDGNEVEVLKGAQETLKKFRPMVLVEFSPIHYRDRSETFAEQVELLKSAGYEFQTLNRERIPQEASEIEKQIPWGVLVNVLGVPK